MSTPMPLDFNALTFKLGHAEITIMQLKYQVQMLSDELLALKNNSAAEIQQKFDDAVDARDMPSGATVPPDLYSGD